MKRRQRSTDMAKWRSASSSRSSVAGPGPALRSVLLRRMAALHCRGRTQPPATASNIGRRGRTGLQLAPDLDAHAQADRRPGLLSHPLDINQAPAGMRPVGNFPHRGRGPRRRRQHPSQGRAQTTSNKTPASAEQQHDRAKTPPHTRKTERFVSSSLCVYRHRQR